jgi:hypothetical protein
MRFVDMDAGMTPRSATTATNELSRLDSACRSLAQLEQSEQDLVVEDRRAGGGGQGWPFGLRFPRAVGLVPMADRLFAEPRRLGDQT